MDNEKTPLYPREVYLRELSDIALGTKTFMTTNTKGDDIEAYPDLGERIKAIDLILKLTAQDETKTPQAEPFRLELAVMEN